MYFFKENRCVCPKNSSLTPSFNLMIPYFWCKKWNGILKRTMGALVTYQVLWFDGWGHSSCGGYVSE